MMRRLLGLLFLFMAILVASFAWADDKVPSVDLVIIIDQSNSMEKLDLNSPPSDPKRYRLDAATILINMLEMGSSRVAIVPFNDGVVEGPYWNTLFSVGREGHTDYRRSLSDAVGGLKTLAGSTDLGTALMQAVAILDAAPSTEATASNGKMIVVLTDGDIYIYNETESRQKELTEISRQKAQQAIADCVARGYKLYPLALASDKKQLSPRTLALLGSMAADTGGKYMEVFGTPEDLPRMFGEMFGEQIGSTMLHIVPAAVPEVAGRYVLAVDIPNRSVIEANIMIPSAGIVQGSVKVYPPGQLSPIAFTAQDRHIHYKSANFEQIKLVDPVQAAGQTGRWRIEYDTTGRGDVAQPTVNLLFNYNVQLRAQLERSTVYKNESVAVIAQFYEGFAPSTDPYLYTGNIKAELTLRAAGGETPIGNDVMAGEENRFYWMATLDGLGISRSGVYTLDVRARGDGLDREAAPVTLTVENRAPRLRAPLQPVVLETQNPADARWYEPATYTLHLDTVFEDADGDMLTYAMEAVDNDAVSIALSEGVITVTAYGPSWNGEVLITATDYPEGAQAQATLQVRIKSLLAALDGAVYPQIMINGQAANEAVQAEKGEEVAVSIRLMDSVTGRPVADTQAYTADDLMQNLALEAVLTRASAPDDYEALPLRYDATEGVYTGVFSTDHREDAYAVTVTCGLHSLALPAQQALVNVGNLPPVAVADALAGLPALYSIEPLIPGLELEPWHALTQPVTLDLAAMFEDPNGEVLSYPPPAFEAQPQDITPQVAAAQVTVEDGHLWRIEPTAAGEWTLRLSAVDNDGALATLLYTYEVRSIRATLIRMIIIAVAAIVALVLLIVIIRQAIKPRFGLDVVDLYRDNYLTQRGMQMPRGKGKHTWGRYFGADALDAVRLPDGFLAHIVFAPSRMAGAVDVRSDNPRHADVQLLVNGKDARRKKWERGVTSLAVITSDETGTPTTVEWRVAIGGPEAGEGSNPF